MSRPPLELGTVKLVTLKQERTQATRPATSVQAHPSMRICSFDGSYGRATQKPTPGDAGSIVPEPHGEWRGDGHSRETGRAKL